MGRFTVIPAYTKEDGTKVKLHVRRLPNAVQENINSIDENVINDVLKRSKEGGAELDAIAEEFVQQYNGVKTDINLKKRDRIIIKAILEKGGDLTKITDTVRNTVVIESSVFNELLLDLENDSRFKKENNGRVKPQDGPEYFGYKGLITNVQLENGIVAEMQFNVDSMIYAKSKKEDAIKLLGQERYNQILNATGVVGGKGHKLYSRIRTESDPEIREKLIRESEEYYSIFRNLLV